MKKLIFILIVMFTCIINVYADELYVYYECGNKKDWPSHWHMHNTTTFEKHPFCNVDYTITLTSYKKGKADHFDEGGKEEIQNPMDHYPNFISVVGANYVDWYAADDIDTARNFIRKKWNPRGIYIKKSYLEQLKAGGLQVDKTVYKTCNYGNTEVDFNKDGYAIDARGKTISYGTNYNSINYASPSSEFLSKPFISIKDTGECPDVNYCSVTSVTGSTGTITTYYLFRDTIDAEKNNFTCDGGILKISNEHIPDSCDTYSSMLDELDWSYYLPDKTRYNTTKDSLINLCNFVIDKHNYTDPCVKACLNTSEDISAIEKKNYNTNECGFSTELIVWIGNILRWVKYLVPIILIVLSILDFIKALSSEKEDEMKKAQKNFVTRLIVAVLIFIFPMIVEFVLDKMGFDATNCEVKNIGF